MNVEVIPTNRPRAARITHGLMTLAVLVLAALGVYGIFSPAHAPQSQSHSNTPQSVVLPDSIGIDMVAVTDSARGIARAYLTLDNPQAREQRLGQFLASPGENGWNGQGAVTLSGNAYVVATDVIDAQHVDVTVALFATVDPDAGVAGWIGVKVPIQIEEGNVSGAGQPRIVGLPEPAALPTVTPAKVDPALSQATRADVETFFNAYASGDVSAVVAPGSRLNAPAKLGTLTVNDWQAIEGEGETRQGRATVTWQYGAATLTQTYLVTLSEVTAQGGKQWRVADVH